MKWLALAMVLVGCGPEGWTYTSDCVTFESKVGLYQVKVDQNVSVAKEMFDGRFGAGSFCRAVSPHPVVVRAVHQWECPWDLGMCGGFTDTFGHIEIGRSGMALLHEAIHAMDIQNGRLDTGQHQDWDVNGYYDLDNQYGWKVNDNWLTP